MRRLSVILVVLAWPVVFTPPAQAQNRLELELSPFAGGAFFLGDGPRRYALQRTGSDPLTVEGAHYEDGWTAGFSAGLRLSDAFSVETHLAWVPTWLTGTNLVDGTDVYAYMYGLTGIARLPIAGPLRPYWGMGVGAKPLTSRDRSIRERNGPPRSSRGSRWTSGPDSRSACRRGICSRRSTRVRPASRAGGRTTS